MRSDTQAHNEGERLPAGGSRRLRTLISLRQGKVRSVASFRPSSRPTMGSRVFWLWRRLSRCTRHSFPSQRRRDHFQNRICLSAALAFQPPETRSPQGSYSARYRQIEMSRRLLDKRQARDEQKPRHLRCEGHTIHPVSHEKFASPPMKCEGYSKKGAHRSRCAWNYPNTVAFR